MLTLWRISRLGLRGFAFVLGVVAAASSLACRRADSPALAKPAAAVDTAPPLDHAAQAVPAVPAPPGSTAAAAKPARRA